MVLMKRWMTFILGWLIGVSAFVTFAIEKSFPIVSEQDKGQWFALFQQRQAASLRTDGQDDCYDDTLLGSKWSHYFNWHPNWYLDGKREVMQVADEALLSKATSSPSSQLLFQQREGYRREKMQLSFISDKLYQQGQ